MVDALVGAEGGEEVGEEGSVCGCRHREDAVWEAALSKAE